MIGRMEYKINTLLSLFLNPFSFNFSYRIIFVFESVNKLWGSLNQYFGSFAHHMVADVAEYGSVELVNITHDFLTAIFYYKS